MNLATATDLTRWAGTRDAQSKLPKLVRRLISCTGIELTKLSIRSEEGVSYPGYDGVVISDQASTFVPQGVSVWEMGVNSNPKSKVDDDYNKRTKNPEEFNPKETTFVFVTPTRWGKKNEWVLEKTAERAWKNVIVYDADDLEAWLEQAPSVHAWFSALIGKEPYEVESLETWWESWINETNPILSPAIILSGREEAENKLHKLLQSAPTSLAISGDSKEEALAFIAASLINIASKTSPDFQRALIVRSPAAWRRIAVSEPPLILQPIFDKPNINLAIQNRHHVIIPLGREIPVSNGMELPRLKRSGIEESLMHAGIERDRASNLATVGRRSILSLRRILSVNPEIQVPKWSMPENANEIITALFIGEWCSNVSGDRDVLSSLANKPFDEVSESFTKWANTSDPPIRHVGNIWFIISKEDTWRLLAHTITADNLQRFREIAIDVLSEVDPALALTPEERIMAPILGKQRSHSENLIKGIADTLALMASSADQITLANGSTGQDEASIIVHKLLEIANGDSSGSTWITLSNILPALAEAAPEEFLKAIEISLQDDVPLLTKMFQDSKDAPSSLNNSSAHTGLLWALEALAWSTEYLSRVVLILAKLIKIDPGGKLLNRPGNSMHEILLLWRPGTSASLEQKLEIVNLVRRRDPMVAWSLMLNLIPSSREHATMTYKPKWRDWKCEKQDGITYSELDKVIQQLVDWILEDVGVDAVRWRELIERVPDLPSKLRGQVINTLSMLNPSDFIETELARLISSIKKFTGRQKRLSNQDWAISKEEISELENAVSSLEPKNLLPKYTWLFDQGAIYSFNDESDKGLDELSESQKEAMEEILESIGITEILSWAEDFKSVSFSARQIGNALSYTQLTDEQEAILFGALFSNKEAWQLTSKYYISGKAQKLESNPSEWAHSVLSKQSSNWTDFQKATFLLCLPATPDIWDFCAKSGNKIEKIYWTEIGQYALPHNGDTCLLAVQKLCKFGKPYLAVIPLDYYRESTDPGAIDTELIVSTLEQAAKSSPPASFDSMFSYHVGELLEYLSKTDFDRNRIAALEWFFLPLFKFEKNRSHTLHQTLAEEPKFFVEVVSFLYRTEDDDSTDPASEEEKNRANTARELLDSWRIIPGIKEDGTINYNKLNEWVQEARNLLKESNRLTGGDYQIGKILRYGPPEKNDIWPDPAISDLIEEIQSPIIEEGLEYEVYNSRGVTVRSPIEGGEQERELANRYKKYAKSAGISHPRTTALLNKIASHYERDATRNDQSADLTEDLWQ